MVPGCRLGDRSKEPTWPALLNMFAIHHVAKTQLSAKIAIFSARMNRQTQIISYGLVYSLLVKYRFLCCNYPHVGAQSEMQYRCSIHWMHTSQTLQYILQVHCNYVGVYVQCMVYCMCSRYCNYTIFTTVVYDILHEQYTLQYVAYNAINLLRLGSVHAGCPANCSVWYTLCAVDTATTLF